MATEHYQDLVDQICAYTLIPHPASLYHATNLTVREIDFSLQYIDGPGNGSTALLCDFGPLPTHKREEVLLRLLEMNFYMSDSPSAPMLSFNDQSQRVTLTCNLELAGLQAEVLVGLMGQFADMAKGWRNNHFLAAPGESKRAPNVTRSSLNSSSLSALR